MMMIICSGETQPQYLAAPDMPNNTCRGKILGLHLFARQALGTGHSKFTHHLLLTGRAAWLRERDRPHRREGGLGEATRKGGGCAAEAAVGGSGGNLVAVVGAVVARGAGIAHRVGASALSLAHVARCSHKTPTSRVAR